MFVVSILTRGKPRVELRAYGQKAAGLFQSSLEGNPEWNGLYGYLMVTSVVSILTRGKPRVELSRGDAAQGDAVSILTRGKPRVER